MKKLLLATTLAIAAAIGTLASTVHAQTSKTSQVQKVQVKDLSFKNVMRALYAGRMQHTYVNDETLEGLEGLPYIGLTDRHENLVDGESLVAFMHPVMSYTNNDLQTRYLVAIEKITINDEGGFFGCHACGALLDLYVFKDSPNGYELVSRTPKNHNETIGQWGRADIDFSALMYNVQPLGRQLTGAIFESSDGNQGIVGFWWSALHLPEDGDVGIYYVSDGGGSNTAWQGEDSPLSYEYGSELEVIDDGSVYFPIRLHFTGDMPDENYDNIQEVDFIKEVRFDPIAKEYR